MRIYKLKVRKHFMIAHSFRHESFGPAKNLHGATYVVDTEIACRRLGEANMILNIDDFTQILESTLAELNLKNLDDMECFAGQETTTEFLCEHLLVRLKERLLSETSLNEPEYIEVTLNESHIASASCRETFTR